MSLRIKHVDLKEKSVTQNPREVATKFGKSIDIFFARRFQEAEDVLAQWMKHLDEVKLYSPDDPLFPATELLSNSNMGWERNGFDRRHWKTTGPVRKIVNEAFYVAGQPNNGPHSFRHMLARHAVDSAQSPAELVATSQNLGHSGVFVTLANYGQISRERQRQLVTGENMDSSRKSACSNAN